MTSHAVPLHRLSIMLLGIILFAGFCAANGEEAPPPKKKYTCPTHFVRHGNSCYYFSSHMATWFEAHFACRDLNNSELAILEKGWEDRNMRTYLNKPELTRLERWIGGIYNWETKRWVWGANGGNPLKYQGFSQMSKDHEPRWNCIIMDPAMMYKWSGRLCIDKKHYICEMPLKKIPSPHPHANEPRKPKKGKDNWKMKKPRDPSKKRKDPNRRLNDLQRQQRLQRKGRRQRQQLRRQQAPKPHPLNTTGGTSVGIPYQNQNLHEQAQPYVNWSNYHKYRYLRVPEISYQEKVLVGK